MPLRQRGCAIVGAIAAQLCPMTCGGVTDAGVFDDRYATACGPIACYVALQELGLVVTLETLVADCKWTEGGTVGLHDLWRVLRDVPDIVADPVRLTPNELRTWLSETEGVAILAIRKHTSEIDHAVAAVGAVDEGIVVVDYPELAATQSLSVVANDWDGAAILVRRAAEHRTYTISAMPITTILLASLVLGLIVVLSAKGLRRGCDQRTEVCR